MADLTRQQQMDKRRERILEAARGLIESRGYAGLTMRELARTSGVTVPTAHTASRTPHPTNNTTRPALCIPHPAPHTPLPHHTYLFGWT